MIFHENHKKPRTRRDFMGLGMLGMSTYIAAPSLVQLLVANQAFGASCKSANPGRKAAFLCFDLVGGANIAGSNVMVGKEGGQKDFLGSYRTLGLPSSMDPKDNQYINEELGLVFHSDSAFLRGIQDVTSAETREKIDGAVFCGVTGDDTANNPLNPSYWIHRAGAKGDLVGLMGSSSSKSGGRSVAPSKSIDPSQAPVIVRSPDDAMGIVRAGQLIETFGKAQAARLLKAIEGLSLSQVKRFSAKSLPDQIQTLVRCGYVKSQELSQFESSKLDPRTDADVNRLFSGLRSNAGLVGSIAKLAVDGFGGPGTIQLAGYDYHDSSRSTGERKDYEAGQQIGRCLELARLKGKDLVIYVFSDGSVSSSGRTQGGDGRGKGVWSSDSGSRSSTFMLVYRHAEKPKLRSTNRQVGAFTDAGAVNRTVSKISNNVENLTMSVVANYLALHGDEGNLREIVGSNEFQGDLDKYLVFDKSFG